MLIHEINVDSNWLELLVATLAAVFRALLSIIEQHIHMEHYHFIRYCHVWDGSGGVAAVGVAVSA